MNNTRNRHSKRILAHMALYAKEFDNWAQENVRNPLSRVQPLLFLVNGMFNRLINESSWKACVCALLLLSFWQFLIQRKAFSRKFVRVLACCMIVLEILVCIHTTGSVCVPSKNNQEEWNSEAVFL